MCSHRACRSPGQTSKQEPFGFLTRLDWCELLTQHLWAPARSSRHQLSMSTIIMMGPKGHNCWQVLMIMTTIIAFRRRADVSLLSQFCGEPSLATIVREVCWLSRSYFHPAQWSWWPWCNVTRTPPAMQMMPQGPNWPTQGLGRGKLLKRKPKERRYYASIRFYLIQLNEWMKWNETIEWIEDWFISLAQVYSIPCFVLQHIGRRKFVHLVITALVHRNQKFEMLK